MSANTFTKAQLVKLLQEHNLYTNDLSQAKKFILLEKARSANLIEERKIDKPKLQCKDDQECVPLRDREGVIIDWALINSTDSELVNISNWHLINGYAHSRNKGLMHVFLLGKAPTNQVIDHIDRNKLNNTRANLRYVSASLNSQNLEKRNNTSSKYFGVDWKKGAHRWRARHTNTLIGLFDNEDHAAFAYDEFIRNKFGSHGRVNGIKKPAGYIPYTIKVCHTKRGITKNRNKYKVQYHHPITKARIYLGRYDTEEEASQVYETYRRHIEERINIEHLSKQITRNEEGIGYINASRNGETVQVLVDDNKWHEFSKRNWHIDTNGYAKSRVGHMHKQVLDGDLIDHRNGKLDNRRCFLAVNDCSGNAHNTPARSELGYKGVSWNGKRIQAEITKNKVRRKLGNYEDVNVAAYAYNCAAKQLYGDLAKLNDVEQPTDFVWDPVEWKLKKIHM
jgi:hypothetical protein